MAMEPIKCDGQQFEVEGKDAEWHTAFYYLAEHARYLSKGRVNHKEFYSLVGVDGRYLNHANPIIRKSTAGALSRIVHTRRYVQDMQSRYMQNGAVFRQAASILCESFLEASEMSSCDLYLYLRDQCWPQVLSGLEHEWNTWRNDLDLRRVEWEMQVLFDERDAPAGQQVAGAMPPDPAGALSALLHVIAFGHLEVPMAHRLIDDRPTEQLASDDWRDSESSRACLVKFTDADKVEITGSWILPSDRLFTMGRYTDCDAIELDDRASRKHGCIYRKHGEWLYEDMGSKNGSSVICVDGHVAYDSRRDGARVPVSLKNGDSIVLADCSVYWFGLFRGDSRSEAMHLDFA